MWGRGLWNTSGFLIYRQSHCLRQLWLEEIRVAVAGAAAVRFSDLLTRVVAVAKLPLYFGLEVASQPTLERIRSNDLPDLIVLGFRGLEGAYLMVAANRGESSQHRANRVYGCRQEIHQPYAISVVRLPACSVCGPRRSADGTLASHSARQKGRLWARMRHGKNPNATGEANHWVPHCRNR
jgi:hypothetical protein